jgi:pimeloyl-ACP methyl ester carboxylesterase
VGNAEPSLVEKVLLLDASLSAHGIGHAFGGALALAYYTVDPRATADIDVNIGVNPSDAGRVFESLPDGVEWTPDDMLRVAADEQIRLWWGRNPVDLFFRSSTFHDRVAERAELHPFADRRLPFIAANDLAVFKALFDRPKDWLDIAAMADGGSVDLDAVVDVLAELVGDDERVDRLRSLSRP